MIVVSTLHTYLLSSCTGRQRGSTLSIIETLDTLVLRSRAGSESKLGAIAIKNAIVISIVCNCGWRRSTDIAIVSITIGFCRAFCSSPLCHWAISTVPTFYTTSTINLTVRIASIVTLRIISTEINANTSHRIAVRIDGSSTLARRTIERSTSSGWLVEVVKLTAISARTIGLTISGSGRTISVRLATDTNTSGSVTTRLGGNGSSITGNTLRIGYTI